MIYIEPELYTSVHFEVHQNTEIFWWEKLIIQITSVQLELLNQDYFKLTHIPTFFFLKNKTISSHC